MKKTMSELDKTNRGFYILEFQDDNGEKCSLQASSAIREEGLIWLGINDVVPLMFTPGQRGWKEIKLPEPPPGGYVQCYDC